jgi:hypothetical protein
VWNVNAYMANDNEIPIGAVRPDGTEKPEAAVLAGYAAFAAKSPESFTKIVPPEVTMVTSQVELYSTLGGLALDTQKKALRAMAYSDHTPLRMLPENRLDELCADGVCPKLVFLPSPQGLTEKAWQQLLAYVEKGGTLQVTGPVNRDEHWQEVDRMTPLGIRAEVRPLAVRGGQWDLAVGIGDEMPSRLHLSYSADVQQSTAETMRFKSVERPPTDSPVWYTGLMTVNHGRGTIRWFGEPVEFAEGYDATAALSRVALFAARVKPAFRELAPLSADVLAFPTVLDDAELYSFSNESMEAQPVNLVDALTGAHIQFTLGAQRGAALLLNRDGAALWSYGGAAVATRSSFSDRRAAVGQSASVNPIP